MLSPDDTSPSSGKDAEVCYCKVKLFREYGAERKLSYDVAHVNISIEKLRQQVFQVVRSANNYGKNRCGNGSVALEGADPRPVGITKYTRVSSMVSQNDSGKMSLEDIHMKLALMRHMFTSTRPVSVLALRGEEQDDPDLYPVVLPESRGSIKRENTHRSLYSMDGATLHIVTLTNRNISTNLPCDSTAEQSNRFYDTGYRGSSTNPPVNSRPCSKTMGNKATLKYPTKVPKLASADGSTPMEYLEAVDIDPAYQPQAERPVVSVACFYVRFYCSDQHSDDYYRALYLTERTVSNLVEKISFKKRIDPQRVVRVLYVMQNGLKLMGDDDVCENPDGQDMAIEISDRSSAGCAARTESGSFGPAVDIKLSY
ncbi:hypothetical protein AnigIFM59636_004454 [Aspergillus niger]|nr:hypothetical protein AnigIFM59636_004454 [Aspergillus niger]